MTPRISLEFFADADALRASIIDSVEWAKSQLVTAFTEQEIESAKSKLEHYEEILAEINREITRLTNLPAQMVVSPDGSIQFAPTGPDVEQSSMWDYSEANNTADPTLIESFLSEKGRANISGGNDDA